LREGSPALRLENVFFSYDGRSPVLRGISLSVTHGARVAIMGPSGSGKTTLLRVAAGLLKPQSGMVEVFGESYPLRAARPYIGYIPQNLGLVSNQSVMTNVLMGALPHVGTVQSLLERFPDTVQREAVKALELMGIEHLRARRVWELSGGERQRVSIARALVQKPRLLLADEMVSDLDYVKAREIMELITGLACKMSITLVMVHHDLELVRQYSDTVYLISSGRVAASLPSQELDREALRANYR
jgi:ABC-type phosphate/phosphonate transport system ATPase subunit